LVGFWPLGLIHASQGPALAAIGRIDPLVPVGVEDGSNEKDRLVEVGALPAGGCPAEPLGEGLLALDLPAWMLAWIDGRFAGGARISGRPEQGCRRRRRFAALGRGERFVAKGFVPGPDEAMTSA
jgi:hypothetical protein